MPRSERMSIDIKLFPFILHIGPYYLENKGKVAWGGEARLSQLFSGVFV